MNWQTEFSHPISQKQRRFKQSEGMETASGGGIIYIFSVAKHNEITSILLNPRRKEILKSFYQELVAQSYRTLCNRMDCSMSGSSVHGIFQARILEWVAISKLWKIQEEMGIPYHITCLLRNLYAGQEAIVRIGEWNNGLVQN